MASLAKAFNIFNRAFYSKTPALSFLLQSSLPCNHSMQHAINCLSSKKCLIQPSFLVQPVRFMSSDPTEMVEVVDRVLYSLKLYDKIDQEKVMSSLACNKPATILNVLRGCFPMKMFTTGSHFMKDLGLDSLDHVELIMAMENEFGLYIPDVDAEKLLTAQEIIDYIADKLDVFE